MLSTWPQIEKKKFNRNTLKLSYTCTPNIKQVIDGHNKAILKKSYTHEQDQTTRMYNCCNQNDCPPKRRMFAEGNHLPSHCYHWGKTEMYVGVTATEGP